MATAPPAPKRLTIDDLASFPDDGRLRELVDGQVVEWDVTNHVHGYFLMALGGMLRNFVLAHRLGRVVGGDPLVRIQGSEHDARGPDVAFYARGRMPRDGRAAATVMVPDFVIEILSPSDRADMVQRKVRDWLRAGVRLLWYVDPETGETAVYHGGSIRYVDADDVLDGAEVVPGFTLRIRDIMDELAEQEEFADQQ
jgi:Uma2 family endonuclease